MLQVGVELLVLLTRPEESERKFHAGSEAFESQSFRRCRRSAAVPASDWRNQLAGLFLSSAFGTQAQGCLAIAVVEKVAICSGYLASVSSWKIHVQLRLVMT